MHTEHQEKIQGGSKKVSCCTVSIAYFFEPPCTLLSRRGGGSGGYIPGLWKTTSRPAIAINKTCILTSRSCLKSYRSRLDLELLRRAHPWYIHLYADALGWSVAITYYSPQAANQDAQLSQRERAAGCVNTVTQSACKAIKVIEVGTTKSQRFNSNSHPISCRFGVIAAYCSNFGHCVFQPHFGEGELRDNVRCSFWAHWKERNGLR